MVVEVYQVLDQKQFSQRYGCVTYGYGICATRAQILQGISKYVKVAQIYTDNLDEAFNLGNIGSNPKLVKKCRTMHSISVGDILVFNGIQYIIGGTSFDELPKGVLVN